MAKFILGGVLWAAIFFAVFPMIMVVLLSAVANSPAHHVDGRQRFLRDYYLISLPLMPGGAAFFAVFVASSDGTAGMAEWCVAAVFLACGIALYWMPTIRAAIGRLRAAAAR